MDTASKEVSLAAHSAMLKEGEDHLSVVIFTKENMEADNPVPVVNLPPVRFIGGPSKQGITENVQGAWGIDISVSVVIAVGVPVEEALEDIVMNSRRAVIRLECDC